MENLLEMLKSDNFIIISFFINLVLLTTVIINIVILTMYVYLQMLGVMVLDIR